MRTGLLAALPFLFLGCIQGPSGRDDSPQDIPEPPGRPLGHIRSYYPVLAEDGQTWKIEIRLDSMTILAPLAKVQDYASDSLGKALLRNAATEWYSRDGDCFFAAEKTGCLEFEKNL